MSSDTSWDIFRHNMYCLLQVYTYVVKAQNTN